LPYWPARSSTARYCAAVSRPPWDLAAHHEHVVLADALFLAALPGVAVFLLVAAVELEELLVVLGEVVGILGQLVGDGAAELPAVFLDVLGGGALGGGLGSRRRFGGRGGSGFRGHDAS